MLDWQGAPRKLLLHANRNGFFYVLDRTTGALLRATPFVKKLTWAREIGADGRPVLNPGQEPTPEGTRVCPAVEGATNWFSTAFTPKPASTTCRRSRSATSSPGSRRSGRRASSYYGGSTRTPPDGGAAEDPPRHRRPERCQPPGSCRRSGPRTPGEARSRRRAVSSSSAKTAAPSRPPTPRAERLCGGSRRTSSGKRPR